MVARGYIKGMTTTPHTSCTHPATKAARAKCRKLRTAAEAHEGTILAEIVASYYAGADLEGIAGAVSRIRPDLAQGYYDETLDAEEFIASLQS
jgi:hypothetical protein